MENTPSVTTSRVRASRDCFRQSARLRKADAVDDAGVVERVRDDRVALVRQGLEQAAVGVEAGRIEDRVVRPEEPGELLFQLPVHGLRAADEANGSHAVAVAVDGAVGRLPQQGVVGQAEVVVGAEVDDVAIVGETHDGLLGRGDDTLPLVQSLGIELRALRGEPVEK
jgi:hypothetical protein